MATQTTVSETGNAFVATAYRQVAPEALFAYPITPQTTIVEEFARYVANGKVKTEFVTVESEHSAMSACIGSAAAGARTMTATSSQGLALMWEELPIAAGLRLPIVMANANRAIGAPINIHCDHSDVMGARDSGWIIMFAENAQEAYDHTIMAIRIAEENSLPVMPALDGFITTHSISRGETMDDKTVTKFVGVRKPQHSMLDSKNPIMVGGFSTLGNTYMNIKKALREAIDASLPSIKNIGDEWGKLTGRSFDHVEGYGMEDAEEAILVLGSAAGNVRAVTRKLRAEGRKVGMVKLRTYRPFPAAELADMLKGCKAIAVLDRSDSYGAPAGPLALDTMAALYKAGVDVALRPYIFGLGGADVKLVHIERVYNDLADLSDGGLNPGLTYLGI
ncbi:MAG: pyruvate ferredoxin oxidoreductase [Actinomycetia bacterium]|nr:pyruvate ferredoxin oxidoreductase [Actinomycetes bacterium]